MRVLPSAKKPCIYLTPIFLYFSLFALAGCTLSKNDRKGGHSKKKDSQREERATTTVMSHIEEDGDTANESALKKEILQNYEKLDTGARKFAREVTLGYVTVWNNHGYDVAKWAAKKFTHISPVWFQLKSARVDGQLTCTIGGTHDIDMGWMEDILKNNSATKIVPRFLFEGWNGNDLKQFLSEEQAQYRCVRAIVELLTRSQMDGAVMEIWLQIMAMTRGTAVNFLLELIQFWAAEFHKAGLLFILPLSPPLNDNLQEVGIVNREVIIKLLAAVDYINVMTYDYPSAEISGVAPIHWVEANLRYFLDDDLEQDIEEEEEGEGRSGMAASSKILMGLNFYGYDRSGAGSESILGKRYIELLSMPDSVLDFDAQAAEHRLTFGRNGVVFFPTVRSIQLRLDLASQLGIAGVAIWDLGQGLNHFTSVL